MILRQSKWVSTMKILRGDRNQCQLCKQYFNSTGAFDKHRTGQHGVNRRCKTPEEMVQSGMVMKPDGFWIGSPMKNYRESEREQV
jgi:hypothetical protein